MAAKAEKAERDTLPTREERCITAKSVARAARRLVRIRCLAEPAAACTAVSCSTCPITRHIKSPPAVPTWSEPQRQYLYFCTNKASTFVTVKQDLDAFFAGKQGGAHIKGRQLHCVPLRLLRLLHVSHSVYVVNQPRIQYSSSMASHSVYIINRQPSTIRGRSCTLTHPHCRSCTLTHFYLSMPLSPYAC
jgi:hypothetical protein